MNVTLTWPELRMAAEVGMQRRLRSLQVTRSERYGTPAGGLWENDIQAAAAEMAVAKFLGVYWAGAVDPDYSGDVGPYEVRWTARLSGSLILHDADMSESAFILVTGVAPTFRLPGWLVCRDGRKSEFWQEETGRPCYMVPQSVLRAISELVRG